jgi:integrase
MTKSRKVGPFRVRPQVRNGIATGKYFLDIPASISGRRKRKLFDSQRKAVEVAKSLMKRFDPVSEQLLPRQQASGLRFREAVELWKADEELRVQTLKKKASTLAVDLHRLRAFERFWGDEDLAAIDERKLVAYQSWRLQQGISPSTVNSDITTFSVLMGWAFRHGHISQVPKVERVPVRRKQAFIPTPEEVVRIIDALPERLQPLVRLLAETGCRKGEATYLTWDCVDEVNGFVEIQSRDGWTPKTMQSERRIPISESLLDVLRSLPKDSVFVFPGKKPDKPIGCFKKALNDAVRRARIERRGQLMHVTPQTFRRAHATWQAMRGTTESVLQDLLGHASGSRVTRQFYVHVTEDAKKAAVIQLPMRDR